MANYYSKQDNPQYAFKYQVSDEKEQTYIAHDETRDGAAVTGQYSYVDPLGNLIIVKYIADENGYQETREVQAGFLTIRAKPVKVQKEVVVVAPPKPRPAPRPAPQRNDADLVAKIIAQLTPFIKTTVSDSLGSRTQTRVVQVQQPVVTKVVPVVTKVASTSSLFGVDGENRITVETPNYNFDEILFK
jgi:hypothetical protein